MTVLLPEVAAEGAEAGAGAEAAAEGRVGAGARKRAAERARSTAQAAPGYYSGQASELSRQQVTPGSRNYQGVILAEFLTAVLVVAFVPLVKGSAEPGKGATTRPSPYNVNDIVQLVAIGAVYFVLALISSGGTGRVAAWLGGLVLLTILLAKLANGQISAVVSNLQGQGPANPSGPPPPGTQIV